MARNRSKKAQSARRPVDLEAIGLVLLSAGASLFGLLLPQLPTGELGALVQRAVTGRIGYAAYALPWPLLVLGVAFLLRRNPRGWPRVLTGYLLTLTGLWGLAMVIVPAWAGSWGVAARDAATGPAGAALAVPALLLVTFGTEAMAAWTPTRILRATVRGLARATRRTWRAAAAGRRALKVRAAFRADVALVRGEVVRVAKDLDALSGLYPGSGPLARWREQVEELRGRLRGVDEDGLAEARADVAAWREAVDDYTAARAAEMVDAVRAEEVRDFAPWRDARGEDLAEPVGGTSRTARGLDGVRKALALDLTALDTRYRKLTRARDQAEATLSEVDAAGLVTASHAHAQRRAAYKEVAAAAEEIEADAERIEAWRELAASVGRMAAELGEVDEVQEFDEALGRDLQERGRTVLTQLEPWSEARVAVERRGRVAAEEAARRAREEARAHDASEGADTSDADAELLGPGDVPDLDEADLDGSHPDGAGPRDGGDDAGVAGGAEDDERDAPPFEPTSRARGATRPPTTPAATRDAGDVPEVGGIEIQIPPLDLLDPVAQRGEDPRAHRREVEARVRTIDETLANFKLQGRVVSSVRGPTVTRFEVEPAPGEKIARFATLADDLARAMAASSVRIEAPIPGKSVIGLEVPNADRDLIRFREAAQSPGFVRARARLPLILGKSVDGEMVIADLAKMPHLLIAGSTGSGKSVAVNTLIASLLYKFLPTDLRLLLIDPKMVELTPYEGVPHLLRPVVTDADEAVGVLLGAVAHMERRYKMMRRIKAKNLDQYNEKARNLDLPHLPFIAIVIDELADLMITSGKEVETAIMRLAQMARATGMHLILATQRPSVDMLTAAIKINVPARVAFAVASGYDSRTILDSVGAERLVGNGDMLFYQPGMVKTARLQGPLVSEDEIAAVTGFLRRQFFDDEFVEAYGGDFEPVAVDDSQASGLIDWKDDKLRAAAELVINERQASVSRLQRRLQVGHARAGKLMDSLEALGVVGQHVGSKPREVLVDMHDLPDIFGR